MDTCTQCVFMKDVGCIRINSDLPQFVPDPEGSRCEGFVRKITMPVEPITAGPHSVNAKPQIDNISSLQIPEKPKTCTQVTLPYSTIRKITVKVGEPIRIKLMGSYTVLSLDALKCTATCRSDIDGSMKTISFEEYEPESLIRQPEILAHEYGDRKGGR